MQNKLKFVVFPLLILCFIFAFVSFVGCAQSAGTTTTTSSTTTTTTLSLDQILAGMTYSSFEVFPIDLDQYFSSVDLASAQAEILIGAHSLITPFLLYTTTHPEGTGKWYIYPAGIAFPVYSPGQALIKKTEVEEQLVEYALANSVEPSLLYADTEVNLYFDANKYLNLGHIDILKSLFNEIAASTESYRIVEAGEQIGQTSYATALDVQMHDSAVFNGLASNETFGEHLVSPLPYFSQTRQSEIVDYYDEYIYSKMVEGGRWPLSDLDGPYNRGYPASVWSTWYYSSGTLPTTGDGFWYYFPYGILSFLPRSATSTETFIRNPSTGTLVSQEGFEWVGLYIDRQGLSSLGGGKCYVEVLTGDGSTEGIFIMRPFSSPTGEGDVRYLRFEVDSKTSVYWDDELQVKFYDSSSEAGADSFTDPIVYVKDNNSGTPLPD